MCSSLSHRFGPLIRVRLMIGSAKTNIGHLEGGAVGNLVPCAVFPMEIL